MNEEIEKLNQLLALDDEVIKILKAHVEELKAQNDKLRQKLNDMKYDHAVETGRGIDLTQLDLY